MVCFIIGFFLPPQGALVINAPSAFLQTFLWQGVTLSKSFNLEQNQRTTTPKVELHWLSKSLTKHTCTLPKCLLASVLALSPFPHTQKESRRVQPPLFILPGDAVHHTHSLCYTVSIKHLSFTGRAQARTHTSKHPHCQMYSQSPQAEWAWLLRSKASIQCNAVDLRIHGADTRHSSFAERGSACIPCIPMRSRGSASTPHPNCNHITP